MRDPAALARLGTQAWQARIAGACTRHRQLGQLPAARRRPALDRRHPLCRDSRQRHRIAPRGAARAGGHRRPSAEPAAGRHGHAAGRRRLRDPAAPPHHAVDAGWQELALPPPVCRAAGDRPVQQRGVGRLPGLVRQRQLQRQGIAECQRVPCRAGWTHSRRVRAQPRPARGQHRPLRLCQRRHPGRGVSAASRRGGVAPAPVDPGRLAAAASDAPRPQLRYRPARPLEDERQPAPLAGAASMRRAAGIVGVPGIARPTERGRNGVRRIACRSIAGSTGGPGADPRWDRLAPLLLHRRPGTGPHPCRCRVAVQPARRAGNAAGRRGAAVAVADGSEPAQAAGMDDRRTGTGGRAAGPAVVRPAARAGLDRMRRARDCFALGGESAGRRAAIRAVGVLPVRRLVGRGHARGQAAGSAAREGSAVPARAGAGQLALLRALCRHRGQPPAARQPAAGAGTDPGAPDVAHQHRPVPAGRMLRPRVWLDQYRGADQPPASNAGHAGGVVQAPRPSAELVRHTHAGGAATRLRLHRRQRQPGRAVAHRRAGVLRTGAAGRGRRSRASRAAGAGRALPHAQRRNGLRVPLRRQAPPVPHRAASAGTGARRELLRPARFRVQAHRFPGHCEGRRAAAPLGRAGTSVPVGGRDCGTQIVVRLDVRIPDAVAADAGAYRRAAAFRILRSRGRTAGSRRGAAPSLGHFRIGLLRPGPLARVPVRTVRRSTPRTATDPTWRPCRCALRELAGNHVPAARGHGQPAAATGARWTRRAWHVRVARLHRVQAAGSTAVQRGRDFHGASPGHVACRVMQCAVRRCSAPLVRRRCHGEGPRGAAARKHAAADRGQRRSAATARARRQPAGAGVSGSQGEPGLARLEADAPAIQRPLHRRAAREWRRSQPLARPEHHALARRPVARCVRAFFLPAKGSRRATGVAHLDPGAGHRLALPGAFYGRPGPVRRARRRHRGRRHRAREPRGRHRVAHGHAAQHRTHHPHLRTGLQLRAGARGRGRRRCPSRVFQPVHPDPLAAAVAGPADDPPAPPARRRGNRGGPLPRGG